MKNINFRKSIYTLLVFSLLWIMFLFTFSRIAFYLYNTEYFPEMSLQRFLIILWGGWHFDLTAVLYTNFLFIILILLPFNFRYTKIYREILKWIFIFPNGIALMANTADIIYYRFTLRRTTASIFSQFANETNLGILSFRFLFDYWYVTLLFILLVYLLIKGYNFIKYEGPLLKKPWLYYSVSTAVIPLAVILFIGGIRGDFKNSTRPITLGNAAEYVSEAKDVNIVLNTPFAIYRTLDKPVIAKVNFFSEKELEKIYSPIHFPKQSEFKKSNVVIIILESFSREFFGIYNKNLDSGNYKGHTPFLDSLIQESKSYFYAFANGRESIDAPVSILASIPTININYSKSHYSVNAINGLGTILKSKGYHTSFFHGAYNGTMNFNSFVKIAGYEHYFGKDEYEQERGANDFDGYWGIWDEEFFEFFADKLNSFPQPFHSVIFSVSSHSPFKIPEKYKDTFKEGKCPIYKNVEYTDFALKQFFQKAATMPWYENTLFVITADHCSALVNYDEYRTAAGYFWIPIIFYQPKEKMKGLELKVAQQIDIMPTVLDYLHYDKKYFAFGKNLLDNNSEEFAFNFHHNTYHLFLGDYLLFFDGEKSTALYKFKEDLFLKKNILEQEKEISIKLETKIKAIIQQYNNRMVEDKITAEK